MRVFAILLGAALIISVGLMRQPAAGADSGASRIIDQTMVCATGFEGGARGVSARAHRGTGRKASEWDRPAFAAVTSGQSTSVFTQLDNSLAWITAGRPTATSELLETRVAGYTYPTRTWGTLAWNRQRCRARAAPIPFTTAGLQGGSAGTFDEEVDCVVPRRVVVRIRATLQSPGALKQYRQFLRTNVPVKEA